MRSLPPKAYIRWLAKTRYSIPIEAKERYNNPIVAKKRYNNPTVAKKRYSADACHDRGACAAVFFFYLRQAGRQAVRQAQPLFV